VPLFFGPLSDIVGRKKIMVIGLLIAILATTICWQASNIIWLLVGRFVQGVGLGAMIAASRGIIPDYYKGPELAKVLSLLALAMPLFIALSPVIGGYITYYYSWQAIFACLLIYLSIIFAYYYFIFDNSSQKTTAKKYSFSEVFKSYRQLISNKIFILHAIYPVFTFIGISAYLATSPFLFQNILGLDSVRYGQISLLIGAVVMLGAGANAILLRWFLPKQLLEINWILLSAGGIVVLLLQLFSIHTTFSLLAACAIFFTSIPFGFPNANSIAYSSIDSDYGAAGSLLTFMSMFSGFVVTGIMSMLPDGTYYPLASVLLICAVLSRIVLYRINKIIIK